MLQCVKGPVQIDQRLGGRPEVQPHHRAYHHEMGCHAADLNQLAIESSHGIGQNGRSRHKARPRAKGEALFGRKVFKPGQRTRERLMVNAKRIERKPPALLEYCIFRVIGIQAGQNHGRAIGNRARSGGGYPPANTIQFGGYGLHMPGITGHAIAINCGIDRGRNQPFGNRHSISSWRYTPNHYVIDMDSPLALFHAMPRRCIGFNPKYFDATNRAAKCEIMNAKALFIFRKSALCGLSFVCSAPLAFAATIGVVAPQSGPFAPLGQQIVQGASAAAGTGNQIVVIPETCEQGSGKQVAEKLQSEKADIAIGFLCVETLTDALPLLKNSGTPAVTISVRSRILMEDAQRRGWPFFRLAPAEGQEATALAQAILTQWQNQPIALVDDGTIYARDLIASVRQKLEAGGIKPVFTDTFRPGQEQQLSLIRRLAKAGATRVVVGGDRNDVAVMARDAQKDGANLTFIGGDVMRAANKPLALPDGVMAMALPDYAKLNSADDAVSVLRIAGADPEGYTLPAYAATQVAEAVTAKAAEERLNILDVLRNIDVKTVIGPVRFDANGELSKNPFRLQVWRDNGWHLVDQEAQ